MSRISRIKQKISYLRVMMLSLTVWMGIGLASNTFVATASCSVSPFRRWRSLPRSRSWRRRSPFWGRRICKPCFRRAAKQSERFGQRRLVRFLPSSFLVFSKIATAGITTTLTCPIASDVMEWPNTGHNLKLL